MAMNVSQRQNRRNLQFLSESVHCMHLHGFIVEVFLNKQAITIKAQGTKVIVKPQEQLSCEMMCHQIRHTNRSHDDKCKYTNGDPALENFSSSSIEGSFCELRLPIDDNVDSQSYRCQN